MIASLSLLSMFALIFVGEMAAKADDNEVAYKFTSLIGLPEKSLNGVKGNGLTIGSRMADLSVSNLSSHEALAGSENSPL